MTIDRAIKLANVTLLLAIGIALLVSGQRYIGAGLIGLGVVLFFREAR